MCNVAHIPIAHGRLCHTSWHTGKGCPEQHLENFDSTPFAPTVAIYPLQMGLSASMVANLDIATKKTLSSTVEVIHASIETLGTIE
jgi:hypothetical protein